MFVLYDGNTTVDGKTSYSTQGGYENVLLYLRLKGLFLTPLSGAGFFPSTVRWELCPQQKTQEILEKNSTFLLRMTGEIQENQNLQRMSKGELLSPHHCKVVDKTKVGIQGSARPQISSVGVEMWVPRFNQGNFLVGCFLGVDFWEPSIFVWWFLVTEWFLSTVSYTERCSKNDFEPRCNKKTPKTGCWSVKRWIVLFFFVFFQGR